MLLRRFFTACTIVVLLSCIGCSREESKKIDLTKAEAINHEKTSKPDAVRIAVGGMITPQDGFAYYREFLDYIGAELGQPVQYVDATNYEEINAKIEARDIEGAIVCSGPYVDGHKKFGMELLAAPMAYGGTVYYSYIIVPRDSSAKGLDDLKGKVFAFTDPLSNTGKLVPEYLIARKGSSTKAFFSKTVFSGSHDKSILAVADKLVDGAAVDSLIWEYLNKTKPALTAKTRILLKSEPYAIPPFVVHPALDPGLKERLRMILLNAHKNPRGKALLDKMMTERFVAIDDKAYDSIREMKKWLAGKGLEN
ncbi:phosphate/phosphite/phosphonate ABC transporter substrate-binding protein [Geobacter pelophilus]|uniref:Phosphate/phosphite/phosphonate ABC transporter substrate-binding protein n=1 Tax=Geoanaerobacter pelophilus TaxID=60036 RepID=A0AAW4L1L6_9BACT|nr:phosphate/phosphite/phosphonate ABC transporter substrate-binding protein [Geoanaerobacter pelophilus]MBT0664067.1 phosphate/phosphite/phosphonate ABC transporter substrate-binding protein [Geoanaerobacter pelophilus]